MHLAVNGWTLIQRPGSPESLQLVELLDALLAHQALVRVSLFHPLGELPRLPAGLEPHCIPAGRGAWSRLLFEQRDLPRAAKRTGADLLFYPYAAAPIVSPLPVLASFGDSAPSAKVGLVERFRQSMGYAGLRGVRAIVQFSDLPATDPAHLGLKRVPPMVGRSCQALADAEDQTVRERYGLPEGYVLCHAVEPMDLPLVLASWTWVEGSTGGAHPLVLLGLEPVQAREAKQRAADLKISTSVYVKTGITLNDLPGIYRGAEAFLFPGSAGRWQSLRWALACGVPVAGVLTPESESVLGDAAYLVPAGDARSLGAACLTLLVEPEVATSLRQKGLSRASGYHGEAPLKAWGRILHDALERP